MTEVKKKSQTSRSRQRIRLTEIAVTAGCVGFVGLFGIKYLIMPQLFKDKAAEKRTVTFNAISDYVIEGDIKDADGNIICGNASPGESAVVPDAEAYSYAWLTGYYSVNSNKENAFGLRGNLKDYSLFNLDENNKGATVTLTTNTELQNFCYDLLNGEEGSVIVLDNKTGAIKAFASQSTIDYNANDPTSILRADVEGSQYRRGTYENDPPGSTFKVITSAAALKMKEDENLDDSFFEYNDTGDYNPVGSDFHIHNFDDQVWGQINLEQALNNSVNTYFANLGVNVGGERIKAMAEKFMIGKTIEIPFLTTISSSMDLGDQKPAIIAQTAFGQGNTQVTPMNMALAAQAIANNGVMMRPYIVSDISQGMIPLYKFFPHKLSNVLDETVEAELKRIMHSTAEGYGLTEERYGMVYAKTGTAECANNRVHTYIIGFTKDAAFMISKNNSDLSSRLWPAAGRLVTEINKVYQSE